MQINRMFEMIYLLLEKQSVTAKELAERFEVSTRTIYRDMEALSAAGVPVYAAKGRGGGIRILPGFVLDKSVLSRQEQQGILSALQGLRAVGDSDAARALDKVSSLFQKSGAPWVAVDLSGWSGRKDLFEQLKAALLQKQLVRFAYYSADGSHTNRLAEPLQLVFKGSGWYLKAFCRMRQGHRLFRLTRIRELEILEEDFDRILEEEDRDEPEELSSGRPVTLKLKIDASCSYRVLDEFAPEQVVKNGDGSFTVTVTYPFDRWAIGFLLSFGPGVEVLEPAFARDVVRQKAREILKIYGPK